MAKAKKSVAEKVEKEFPEFVGAVAGLNVAELEGKLSTYAKEAERVEDAKDADEEFANAKALASELGGPYRDAKKAIRLKSRYLISLIRDKGGDA